MGPWAHGEALGGTQAPRSQVPPPGPILLGLKRGALWLHLWGPWVGGRQGLRPGLSAPGLLGVAWASSPAWLCRARPPCEAGTGLLPTARLSVSGLSFPRGLSNHQWLQGPHRVQAHQLQASREAPSQGDGTPTPTTPARLDPPPQPLSPAGGHLRAEVGGQGGRSGTVEPPGPPRGSM